MLLQRRSTSIVARPGGFVVRVNMPGWAETEATDHGTVRLHDRGIRALIPDTHRNARAPGMHEIFRGCPTASCARRQDYRPLVNGRKHLMVMNAGRSFWHSEETLSSDPPLRMLQIFVRPRAAILIPGYSRADSPRSAQTPGAHLVGSEEGDAPFPRS